MRWKDFLAAIAMAIVVGLVAMGFVIMGYALAGGIDDIESCTDVEHLHQVVQDGHAAEQRLLEMMED